MAARLALFGMNLVEHMLEHMASMYGWVWGNVIYPVLVCFTKRCGYWGCEIHLPNKWCLLVRKTRACAACIVSCSLAAWQHGCHFLVWVSGFPEVFNIKLCWKALAKIDAAEDEKNLKYETEKWRQVVWSTCHFIKRSKENPVYFLYLAFSVTWSGYHSRSELRSLPVTWQLSSFLAKEKMYVDKMSSWKKGMEPKKAFKSESLMLDSRAQFCKSFIPSSNKT
jgi:hypothetical protein